MENGERKEAGPIRFNTSMYGALAANHALVFEAMQNELDLAMRVIDGLRQKLADAEEKAVRLERVEQELKEHQAQVQVLRERIQALESGRKKPKHRP